MEQHVALPDALPGGLDVAAEFQRLLEILLDGGDAGGILHPDRILEVVVEAAVVEVYGTHHGLAVVHHKDLRVDKAGQPLADLHARVQQRLVVRLRQRIGELLVRHMGQDEVDVHAPLCRELEGRFQLTVEDEVGRHDVDVALGAVEQVDIDHLPHPLTVQRAVAVRGREPLRRDGVGRHGEELLELRLPEDAPHLEEEDGQRSDSLAFQHDGGVLPAAILLDVVDVLVGEVHAAGKTHLAVNDENFPVVAVIIMGRDKGLHRREHPAPDAQLFEAAGVIPGQGGELTGAVVHHPDVHALSGLAGQHFEDPAPHEALVDDEVLEEDVLLGLFQLAQQLFELGLAAGEVGDFRVPVDREAAALSVEIPRQRGRAGVGFGQLPGRGQRLGL